MGHINKVLDKNKPMRAVLFDVDNTLLDFVSMKRACCEAAVREMIAYGLHIDYDAAMKTLYELFEQHGWENPQIFQRFLEATHGKVDDRILANGVVAYRRAQLSTLKPYPSVIPTLMKIREAGIATGVVSDAPNRNGWIRLVETGLQHFFDVAVYTEDTGKLKSTPQPFLHALEQLKKKRPELHDLKAEEALMVGDYPERDVQGAQRVGMKTCFAAYGNPFGLKAPTADFTINKFEDLLGILGIG